MMINFASCYSVVETLDLSFNSVVRACDIPVIAAEAPSIRRLVLIGCPAVKEDELFELLREGRKELHSLEGILHPALLTVTKPDSYPSAFTYIAKRNSGELSCASIPLFTPAQIVQALCDLIPWKAQPGTIGPKPGGIVDASEFIERGLPMIGACALHSGVRSPGSSIGQRPVVSVPLLSPIVPRGEKELWVFYFEFESRGALSVQDLWNLGFLTRAEPDKGNDKKAYWERALSNGWAFMRLTARAASPESCAASADAKADGSTAEKTSHGGVKPLTEEYVAKVYDLDGFLGCMERDGRPMPDEDAVRALRERLGSSNPQTGAKWVPFLNKLKLGQIELKGRNVFGLGDRYGSSFPV